MSGHWAERHELMKTKTARHNMTTTTHPLYALLQRLERARIHFTLGRYRSHTVLVTLTVVGARIEVEVFDDGHMEVSQFTGHEDIVGGLALVERIIDENSDSAC
jgi:hypothetical protein